VDIEKVWPWLALAALLLASVVASADAEEKPGSVFLPEGLMQQARKNMAANPQAAAMRE
jgi:hypothetical protein